jgi:hypothetical protein
MVKSSLDWISDAILNLPKKILLKEISDLNKNSKEKTGTINTYPKLTE